MDLGKLDKQGLYTLFFNNLGRQRENIWQGSSFGVDTSIIRLNPKKCLITSSDPASFIPSLGIKESAWLTVILTANDIATSGYLPEYAQFVLNLSNTIKEEELKEYWRYIHQFCEEIGISITGGHTGFDDMGNSTLAGGTTMFAIGNNKDVKSSAFAQPHQDLILTKSAALSSASILAKSFPNYVKDNLGDAVYRVLEDSFYQTGILEELKILKSTPEIFPKISAMHDVTEGGALGAIYELCEASQVGVVVNTDKIFIGKEQNELCRLFQLPPLRCIGAGGLLMACNKEVSDLIVKKLSEHSILAAVVGETLAPEKGKRMVDATEEKELEYWEKDPYWDAFFQAIKNGLK